MTARLALLTTDTTHHRYLAKRVAESGRLVLTVVETETLSAPFETHHPFEDDRDAYERDVLLRGREEAFSESSPVLEVRSVNDHRVLQTVRESCAELVVAFGTGRIGSAMLEAVELPLLNLHGGNPEEFRGLDTHLWTVYHNDFDNLVTTLHTVDAQLDTGDIVASASIGLPPAVGLYQLRALNTRVCVDLVMDAARALTQDGCVPRRPQERRGRYYSLMPAVLKEVCVRNFDRHVARL